MQTEDPLGDEAALIQPAMQVLASSRLCKDCKHAYKPLVANWSAAECVRPGLPINVVTGKRRFPCVIARGYDALCGIMGIFHDRK